MSRGEVNAIVSAQNRLNEGKSSEADNNLLAEWADKAERAKAQEQSDAKLRQHVVQGVGRDALENTESSSRGIDSSIKTHLLEAKEQNPADVEKVLNLWREFSNNLFARLSSENLRDPKKVEDALRLANALLQAEPTREGGEGGDAAKQGIEALKKRYGI
ncbi:MAG: hypothetical protein ACD_63C00235G0002 [uncultured bacterium]|nr:MAG: hypothetical protein ACD_63C00235G0002 [uncultured bacterium]